MASTEWMVNATDISMRWMRGGGSEKAEPKREGV